MPELWLRMNLPREKELLSKHDGFDTILLSAHVMETFPHFLSAYIKRRNKPFVIDPYTYVFAPVPEMIEVEEKRWFSKLIGAYGLDYLYNMGRNSLEENDLLDMNDDATDTLKQFVRAVITYQQSRINVELAKLVDYEPDLEGEVRPRFLIAPYFLIQSLRWLRICSEVVREAALLKGDYKLLVPIFISKGTLVTQEARQMIMSALNQAAVDGFIAWVADFRETVELEPTLREFRTWITELSTTGKPVYNMYGGLFSILLADSGMTGISHSICYGEFKDPTTEGGGGQIRYYDPYVRNKIPVGSLDVFSTTLRLPPGAKCNCQVCKAFHSYADLEKISLADADEHFLIRRIDEIEKVNAKQSLHLITDLHNAYEHASRTDSLGRLAIFYEHLKKWTQALSHSSPSP